MSKLTKLIEQPESFFKDAFKRKRNILESELKRINKMLAIVGLDKEIDISTLERDFINLMLFAYEKSYLQQSLAFTMNSEGGVKLRELKQKVMSHLGSEEDSSESYFDLIKQSGLFDPVFYAENYSLSEMSVDELIHHYINVGEPRGWQPNPDFWPEAYLKINMDVAEIGMNPFLHYVKMGRHEGRRTKPLPPIEGGLSLTPVPNLRGRQITEPKRIAVCLHIYYYDLWSSFDAVLKRLDEPFDLYVGIIDRGQSYTALQNRILKKYPNARVFIFPNHGRDVFPFVHFITSGLFDTYEAVCKIHTKKSPHREDGDEWRNHLIDGVLPPRQTAKLVKNFLADNSIGIIVADGQIFEGERWWGSQNKDKVAQLMHRIEVRDPLDHLRFPAGSIFWIKKDLINLIRGMQLTADDFDIEDAQTDGTLAHSFERAIGFLAKTAGKEILQTTEALALKPSENIEIRNKPFVSCFYLPQFHPVPENDLWWGKGYTEWVGVAKSKPQYWGHNQPMVPEGTGFYDLRVPEVIGEQYKLAKQYGVDSFCVYYYSFDHGKRLLEAPIDNLMKRPDIEASFYFCWANESWTRNWDGLSGEIIMPQSYLPGSEEILAKDTAKYFADPRYLRVDDAPRFIIYRPEDIPNLKGFISKLRLEWKKLGFDKVNLGAVLFHLAKEATKETADLFDFFIEMPPHGLVGPTDYIVGGDNPDPHFPVNQGFKGLVYSYPRLIENSIKREFPSFIKNKIVRGVMPSWDNTARRGKAAHICFGANPVRFNAWLDQLVELQPKEIMINSWNEWGEKAMIEPGIQYGMGYLEALKQALVPNQLSSESERNPLEKPKHKASVRKKTSN